MALITLATAKSHLNIPTATTSEDVRVQLFIDAASARISKYCERIFEQTTQTGELHSGRRQNVLLPNQYPVISVSALRISAARDWLSADSLVPASQYVISNFGQTITYDGYFPNGSNNVFLTYVAGYATIPADLQLACLWAVEWYYRHRTREDMGKTTTSKGDESIGILAEMPPMIKEILLDYKRTEMPNSYTGVDNL